MWIFDNPLGNMRGPDFLVLYALVIVIVCVVSYVRCRGVDTTDRDDPPPIPKSPNPHEIAFLRGGVNELARTLIAVLVDAGALEFKSGKLQQTAATKPGFAPNALESKALGYFDVPRSPEAVFQAGGLCERIDPEAAVIESKLREDRQLVSQPMRERAIWKAIQGFVIVAGLGAYKFAAAMDHGRHNVAFLIIGGIAGSLVLIPIGKLPRLTRRGRQHVERLRIAFGSLRARRVAEEDAAMRGSTVALAASLFGAIAVGGIAEAEMTRAFARAAAQGDASGCGAVFACGAATAGSCGGGGCGGGGCGGGGCGGCGGG